jgi:predicted RNase H-like nuclease (RuvC/YqgF family)
MGTLATRKTREKQKASGQVLVQWALPARLRDRIVKKAGGTPGRHILSKQIAETLADIISRKDGISRIPSLEAEVRALRQENQQLRSEIARFKAFQTHTRRRGSKTEQEAAIQARYQQLQQQFDATQAQQRELEAKQRKLEQERRKAQRQRRNEAGLPLVGDWAEPNRSSGSWKSR